MKTARLDALRNVSPNGNAHNLNRPFRSIAAAGRKRALSLHRPNIATMESGENIYNQDDATGWGWSIGVMECWDAGVLDWPAARFQYPIAPLLL